MRRRPFRSVWLRRAGESKDGRGQIFFSVILGVGLAVFLIHQFDAAVRPQLLALAEAQVCNQLTLIADRAVAQALAYQSLQYSDMVILQNASSEEITTVSMDTVRLNDLRTAVMEEIISQVEALDSGSLGIPLGILTGVDLFSAWGPEFPVRVLSVASAEGTYRNEFTSAGINQTLHRVLLEVTVTAKLLLPGGIAETEISAPVCVAETVIIGQVPQTYLNWNE